MENDKTVNKFVNSNEYCEENEGKINKLDTNNIIFLIIIFKCLKKCLCLL